MTKAPDNREDFEAALEAAERAWDALRRGRAALLPEMPGHAGDAILAHFFTLAWAHLEPHGMVGHLAFSVVVQKHNREMGVFRN